MDSVVRLLPVPRFISAILIISDLFCLVVRRTSCPGSYQHLPRLRRLFFYYRPSPVSKTFPVLGYGRTYLSICFHDWSLLQHSFRCFYIFSDIKLPMLCPFLYMSWVLFFLSLLPSMAYIFCYSLVVRGYWWTVSFFLVVPSSYPYGSYSS